MWQERFVQLHIVLRLIQQREIVTEWMALIEIEMPRYARASMTFSGVLHECRKIPIILSRALVFWFVLCIIILKMTTFFC